MPAIGPLFRVAWKVSPIALEVGRQVMQKVRPHVQAYQLARAVNGWVGQWTTPDATHWLVFESRGGEVLAAFPPLSDGEVAAAEASIDRDTLLPHHDLPENRLRETASQVVQAPGSVANRVRRLRGGAGEAR